MTKGTILRKKLVAPTPTYLMESHNGLTAKLAVESGFEVLWASGFAISASLGLADRNIASWSQVADIVESMSDASSALILVDGDTGYGNGSNAQHVVRQLRKRGAAGICIEDKTFPKANSFSNARHRLEPGMDFCAKLAAARDAVPREEFVLVARTETLIAGGKMEEALERASMYEAAGADAIFIHSKKRDEREILEFANCWDGEIPLLIAPTTYPQFNKSALIETGVTNFIWANHALRASITAVRKAMTKIWDDESVAGLEGTICSVDEVLNLTGEPLHVANESRYMLERGMGHD